MLLKLKWSALALGTLFSALQVVPVSTKTTAPAEPAHSSDIVRVAGPEVGAILNRSCKDCHSNETTWPWYSHVAPISWMISKHVTQGREKVNFSEWVPGKLTTNQKAEICDAVSNGSMPLRGYTMLHGNARLSSHDVDVICNWGNARVAEEQNPLFQR
jgi:Haem-binding domain